MSESRPNMAQEIAAAAVTFQQQTTGHAPGAVTVVLSHDALVIALHDALSPAEADVARNAEGAAQLKEFHRELFSQSSPALLGEIQRITGVSVQDAVAELEPTSGAAVQAHVSNVIVQVFRLAGSVACDSCYSTKREDDRAKEDAP